MVACTSQYNIPYLQGTDSLCANTGTLCEPSTVWCDMAAILDGVFTAFDEVVASSIDSFPYAEVAVTTTPFTLTTGSASLVSQLVTWDTVVGDSDNMVDLTANANTVTLRRSGIWNLRLSCVWRSSLADAQLTVSLGHPGAPKLTAIFSSEVETWVEAVADPGTIVGGLMGLSNVLDQLYLVNTATGTVPLTITLGLFGAAPQTATIEQIALSLRWVAELP